jgi:hypothetical protein
VVKRTGASEGRRVRRSAGRVSRPYLTTLCRADRIVAEVIAAHARHMNRAEYALFIERVYDHVEELWQDVQDTGGKR